MADDSIINDPEIIKEFINEFREHIQNMESGLIELEKDPNQPETIKVIFRMAHNIKGSSSYLGLKHINEFTHKLENVLDGFRKGTMAVDARAVDVLFKCIDVLKQQIETFVQSNSDEGVDITGIMSELETLTRSEVPKPEPEKSAEKPTGPSQTINSDAAMLGVFLNSAHQHLDVMETVFHKLLEGDHSPENFDKLFRALNGLKGASHVMGFVALKDLSDHMAQFIDSFRAGARTFDAGLIGLIKSGSIKMREFVEARAQNQSTEVCEANLKEAMAPFNALTQESPTSPHEAKKETPGEGAKKETKEIQADQTIRVSEKRLDHLMNLIGELVVLRNRFETIRGRMDLQHINHGQVDELSEATAFMTRISDELQTLIMDVRLVPVSSVFSKFPRMVRDYSRTSNKKIELVIEGEETELDKTVIEKIGDPLGHLVRNAIDHGLELPEERAAKGKPPVGTVRLRARNEGDNVILEVIDDGRGMDPDFLKKKAVEKGLMTTEVAAKMSREEALNLIFYPGFSTAKEVTDVSGRGVGMDVVKDNVRKLNGEVTVNSIVGQGSTILIRLPLTMAIMDVLMVSIRKELFAFPLASVLAIVRVKPEETFQVGTGKVIYFRGQTIGIIGLDYLFTNSCQESDKRTVKVVVLSVGGKIFGVIVDEFVGNQDVVIKPLEEMGNRSRCISGSAIMGDGRVALILNPAELMSLVGRHENRDEVRTGPVLKER